MKTENKFETGASTQAVNDLIIYTSNTKELAELRDNIYKKCCEKGFTLEDNTEEIEESFQELFKEVQTKYINKYGRENSQHVYDIGKKQWQEYLFFYVDKFDKWKENNA